MINCKEKYLDYDIIKITIKVNIKVNMIILFNYLKKLSY